MKQDILVPFDGSKNAVEALHLAIAMAKSLNEKLIVLNVQPEFQTPNVKRFFSEKDIREYQQQLYREVMDPVIPALEAANVPYEVKLRIGDSKEQIVLEAGPVDSNLPGCATSGVRMIIMGSRGMNPVIGGVLGSVSYGVVNAAPCPITIVPYSCAE